MVLAREATIGTNKKKNGTHLMSRRPLYRHYEQQCRNAQPYLCNNGKKETIDSKSRRRGILWRSAATQTAITSIAVLSASTDDQTGLL